VAVKAWLQIWSVVVVELKGEREKNKIVEGL
jgi:hypothetical protein